MGPPTHGPVFPPPPPPGVVSVPVGWVSSQYGGPIAGLTPIVDLYHAFARGEDGMATPHGMELGAERCSVLRRAHGASAPETPLPARLTALGRYELLDGHHRAARALLEGRSALALDVRAVSPSWLQLEADLWGIYRKRMLYQGIEHPAFDAWPRDRSDQRLALVLAGAGRPQGSLWLDVGSCTGRVCREAQRAGWARPVGVDCDPVVLRVAEYLDGVFGTSCSWVRDSNPVQVLESGWGWDVVTCLSVFHRMIAQGAAPMVATLLRTMATRCRVLITDAASPDDASCAGWAWGDHGLWLEQVTGRKARALGATEGRKVYALER